MGESSRNIRNYEQDHIGYLNLIQNNISRMAGNSALMKGFAATIISAILGVCISQSVKWHYIAIAVIPMLAFIRLDIFYLQMEKRYRNLYTLIAQREVKDAYYTLDLNASVLQKHKEEIYRNTDFFKTMWSISIWQFYIWFVVLIVFLMICVG